MCLYLCDCCDGFIDEDQPIEGTCYTCKKVFTEENLITADYAASGHDLPASYCRECCIEFPVTMEEEDAEIAFFKEVGHGGVGFMGDRLCVNRKAKPGDDAEFVDGKGYLKPQSVGGVLRRVFQPTQPEFVALYEDGYRLCHWSWTPKDGGKKVVIHYWARPQGVERRLSIAEDSAGKRICDLRVKRWKFKR
jgi:hypothetical protein